MSLLDTLGALAGSAPSGNTPSAQLIAVALNYINTQPGGLSGVVQNFERSGLGGLVQSWIANGDNLPVSEEQLHGALGADTVSSLAQQVGMQPGEALSALTKVLPALVNAATPDGQAPSSGQLSMPGAGGAIAELASLFGSRS
ncbi:YidB family protein [Trinickia caryophylli]|uniref:DUF937 domain-containing protein n=1 Tax=Trinickia caryophylli TaxID=28094 RepID=A0A1X7F908_TRICW|nr:YidB family protein [Trinickia caryophylli]PMS08813.1 DUF937 domain-containing protein [Trinickia caryophylli]TRX18961.1 DUF937 domain-containing protein [Trinickia caryophylli]WQE10240.1 YidB family protein [Trinickia caryophylli]SMF48297.1 protein of unknown function [Trinickia caryophylli]GLU34317.1 hypothetical protein Busp01_41590 [Trinickia caryophylli]